METNEYVVVMYSNESYDLEIKGINIMRTDKYNELIDKLKKLKGNFYLYYASSEPIDFSIDNFLEDIVVKPCTESFAKEYLELIGKEFCTLYNLFNRMNPIEYGDDFPAEVKLSKEEKKENEKLLKEIQKLF